MVKRAYQSRAEYKSMDNQYYIHYLTADGRGVDDWFDESELSPAKPEGIMIGTEQGRAGSNSDIL